MKIVALAGSNSSKSINHKFIEYIANQLSIHDVEVIRLTDFNIPMYGIDIENEGFPKAVIELHTKIREADGVIISVAEHNGNVTAFFKSILDWISRYDREFLRSKKWLLFSTAPGKRGGASSLAIAKKTLDYFKGELIGAYSLSNYKSVMVDNQIIDEDVKTEIDDLIQSFSKNLTNT